MPTPHLEELTLELSRWVQDERSAIGEADAIHNFSQATLVSAINRGIRSLMNMIIEKEEDPDKIAVALNEYLEESLNLAIILNTASMPADALKGLTAFYVRTNAIPPVAINKNMLYTTPTLWHATQGTSYNPEEVSANDYNRWTEFGRKIKTRNITDGFIDYMYIKKHIFVNIGNATDLLINDRFDNEILELAQKLIEKVAPIN